MASGDYADLKLQLAYMSGRSAVSQLDAGDLALAGQCINECYMDCYLNPGGTRPGWAMEAFGFQLGAPSNPSVGVTLGSKVVTGYSFAATDVGCTVLIGNNYYTYAGTVSAVHYLVEPCAETTGTYTATLYHNCYPLDANIIELQDAPVVLNWGILMPMNSRAEQWKWKQILYADFSPPPGGGGVFASGVWPGGINYPVGTPLYYRIENGPMIGGNTIKSLFIVEPMPTQVTTLNIQAWFCPTELSADADVPVLPAALSTRVLLPLAREKWATLYKKYSGASENIQGIISSANGARETLNRMSSGQRMRPVRNFLRNI